MMTYRRDMGVQKNKCRVTGRCDCCGFKSRLSSGDVTFLENDSASYLVAWTDRQPSHGIAFLILPTGLGALVSVFFSFEHGSFMVQEPDAHDWGDTEGLSILSRADVVGSEIGRRVFAAIDEIWLFDRKLVRFHRKFI